MALVFTDLTKETTSTTGTGTLTLTGAVDKYQSFANIGTGNTTYYRIESGNDSEVGLGTYNGTLSRDTVYMSIIAGLAGTTKIDVATGATVSCVYPAEKAVVFDANGILTIPDASAFKWSSDLTLYRDAANIFSQRNGTAAQEFRLYNTYTSVSDYERAVFDWTTVTNTLTLGTEAGGTGTKRLLNINTPTSITGTTASDLPTFGAEFLGTPANFTLGAAWVGSLATGFTHTSGAGNTATITYSTLASNNTKYQIVTTVTGRTTGSYTLAFGGTSSPGITGGFTLGPTSTATTGLVITPTFDFNGTIFISIKAILGTATALLAFKSSDNAIRAEIRATAGSTTNNTFIGTGSGGYNTTGANNTGIGYQALFNTTTGIRNTAIGLSTLQANTTANDNTAIGSSALIVNTTGGANTAIGVNALTANTTGGSNVAVGTSALQAHTTSFSNTAIGQNALYAITGGSASNNTGIGYQAGRYIADGSTALVAANNCTYIGYNTKANAANPTNETVIGYNAIGSGSNTTTIGSSTTTATKIFGSVTSTGLVFPQQAATAPAYVLGGIYFDTALNKLRVGGATGWETITSI